MVDQPVDDTFDLDEEDLEDADWDFEDEDEYEEDMIIRAKWSFDGAKTLEEAADMLRVYAANLDELRAEGWFLKGPIEDDYGFLYNADPAVMAAYNENIVSV